MGLLLKWRWIKDTLWSCNLISKRINITVNLSSQFHTKHRNKKNIFLWKRKNYEIKYFIENFYCLMQFLICFMLAFYSTNIHTHIHTNTYINTKRSLWNFPMRNPFCHIRPMLFMLCLCTYIYFFSIFCLLFPPFNKKRKTFFILGANYFAMFCVFDFQVEEITFAIQGI